MEHLIFSLNATIPIFLTMIFGMIFKKAGIFNEKFVSAANKFVFQAALPVLLFQDISGADFYEVWDTGFVLFCFCVTLISILAVTALSFLWKDKSIQGEFVQASYRSSAAILGIAFIQNIYGDAGMAPLMIIATVPLYNVMAVVVLSFLKPDREKFDRALILCTLKGIVTNPIILGIAAGVIWSALQIPKPEVLDKTLHNLSVLATPLGLMAMGASFRVSQARSQMKPAVVSSILKLVVFCAAFLPLAVGLGFRNDKLVAILVMLGSATTVSSYGMARNTGHEGSLTSNTVMLTTLCSAFTLTGWLCFLRMMEFI